jgi:4-hydroxybenzoate polyprenyltransferase
MFKRLQIYIREMFPLKTYIPFAFFNHYVLFFSVQLLLGVPKPMLSLYSLIGVATILGFMLIMRIFDELKDEAVDQELFKSRPYPRGAVTKQDLLILFAMTFFLVVALNCFKIYTLPFFLLCVGYCFLTFKWFFLKDYISTNLFLALLTHQPITLLVNIYVVSTAMVQTQTVHWSAGIFGLAVVFFLPILGWELSRKIKARGEENKYVTYSKLIGYQWASLLSMTVNLSYTACLIYWGIRLDMSLWHILLQSAAALWMVFVYVRFLRAPYVVNRVLKPATEIQSTLATVLFLVFMVLHSGIEWRWFIQ